MHSNVICSQPEYLIPSGLVRVSSAQSWLHNKHDRKVQSVPSHLRRPLDDRTGTIAISRGEVITDHTATGAAFEMRFVLQGALHLHSQGLHQTGRKVVGLYQLTLPALSPAFASEWVFHR